MAIKINGNENSLKNPRAVADRFAKSKPKFVTFFTLIFLILMHKGIKIKLMKKLAATPNIIILPKSITGFMPLNIRAPNPATVVMAV